jgi:hypothetical protein
MQIVYINAKYCFPQTLIVDPHNPQAFLTLARIQTNSDRACLGCVAARVVMGMGRRELGSVPRIIVFSFPRPRQAAAVSEKSRAPKAPSANPKPKTKIILP